MTARYSNALFTDFRHVQPQVGEATYPLRALLRAPRLLEIRRHIKVRSLRVARAFLQPRRILTISSQQGSVDGRSVLTREKAREVYDASGRKADDTRSPYGAPPSELLLRKGLFEEADVILEYGHGTGSFSRRLFERGILKPSVQYIGVDISPVMHKLALENLEAYSQNVTLFQTPIGDPALGTQHLESGSVDRYLSTYVFDLLSEEDILSALQEARRLLKPDGLLCISGITYGNTLSSKLACAVWELVRSLSIETVGGCRPQELKPYVEKAGFRLNSCDIVQGNRSGVLGFMNSEVVIAQRG